MIWALIVFLFIMGVYLVDSFLIGFSIMFGLLYGIERMVQSMIKEPPYTRTKMTRRRYRKLYGTTSND